MYPFDDMHESEDHRFVNITRRKTSAYRDAMIDQRRDFYGHKNDLWGYDRLRRDAARDEMNQIRYMYDPGAFPRGPPRPRVIYRKRR